MVAADREYHRPGPRSGDQLQHGPTRAPDRTICDHAGRRAGTRREARPGRRRPAPLGFAAAAPRRRRFGALCGSHDASAPRSWSGGTTPSGSASETVTESGPGKPETTLPSGALGSRYDRAIHRVLTAAGREVSVREIRQALKNGLITVDGRPKAPGRTARGGERVQWGAFVPRREAVLRPASEWFHEIRVLADEDDLLVLDKPSGLPTHPLRPDEDVTLLNAAIAIRPDVGQAGPHLEGGLVHRLDTGTSGVVVFATCVDGRERLRGDFVAHRVIKRYWALTVPPTWQTHRADGAIGGTGQRVRVLPPDDPNGLPAETLLTVRKVDGDRAWIWAETVTGRRHQVRAHLSALGAPLWGDALYGGRSAARLGLHASELELPDGRCFRSPLPPDLTDQLEAP